MSKPVFQDIFAFSGRRNRKSYILLLVSQIVAMVILGALGIFFVALIDSLGPLSYLGLVAVLIAFIAVCVSGWANGSQRIRDFGHSGVWILLTLVPYIGWIASLAIMFVPSTEGENRYGASCIR